MLKIVQSLVPYYQEQGISWETISKYVNTGINETLKDTPDAGKGSFSYNKTTNIITVKYDTKSFEFKFDNEKKLVNINEPSGISAKGEMRVSFMNRAWMIGFSTVLTAVAASFMPVLAVFLAPVLGFAYYVYVSQAWQISKAESAGLETLNYSANKKEIDKSLNDNILEELPLALRERLIASGIEVNTDPKLLVPLTFNKSTGKILVNVPLIKAMLKDQKVLVQNQENQWNRWIVNSLFTHELRHAAWKGFPPGLVLLKNS